MVIFTSLNILNDTVLPGYLKQWIETRIKKDGKFCRSFLRAKLKFICNFSES